VWVGGMFFAYMVLRESGGPQSAKNGHWHGDAQLERARLPGEKRLL
jgi:hypothetical protein